MFSFSKLTAIVGCPKKILLLAHPILTWRKVSKMRLITGLFVRFRTGHKKRDRTASILFHPAFADN